MVNSWMRLLTLMGIVCLVWQIPCPSVVWSSDLKPLLSQISDDTPVKNSETNQLSIAPIQVYLEPDSGATAGGRTSLFLRVITRLGCSAISVRITDARNLGFTGATEWVLSTRAMDTIQYHLPVTLPLNDTSGMSVYAEGCGTRWDAACYFVPVGSGLTVWLLDPRNSLEAALKRSYSKRIGISDSEYWERMKPNNGQTFIGYPDGKGGFISEDSTKVGSESSSTPSVDELLSQLPDREGFQGQIYFGVFARIDPLATPVMPGANTLRVKVVHEIECSEVTVTVKRILNLGYSGPISWRCVSKQGDTSNYDFSVSIPASDTSGLTIECECGGVTYATCLFWVPTRSGLRQWNIDPRTSYEATKGKSYSRMIGVADSVFWKQQTHLHGYDSIGYEDEHGHLISVDSAHKIGLDKPKLILPGPGDTGTVEISSPPPQPVPTAREIIEAQRRDRVELEKEPLSTADNQTISVGDSLFSRRRGESKFHPAVVTQDPGAYARKIADSLKVLHANDEISVVLDLRNPKDLAAAKQIVDSMKPVNDSGAYRVWLKLGKAKGLRENGLKEVRPPSR